MLYTKPWSTRLGNKLTLDFSSELLESYSHYQKLVSKLIYLTIT